MSIRLMSAIFETEFYDIPLPPEEGEEKERMAKGSSVKLVMLALADHANDEGEGAYPGLTKLTKKTALSRQGLVDVLSAIRHNGLATVADELSKFGTNNYTINIGCLPKYTGQEGERLLVKPLDYPSQATLPELVKSLDHIHPLTVLKPSSDAPKPSPLPLSEMPVEWQIMAGAEQITLRPNQEEQNQLDYALMNLCHNNMQIEPLAKAFMQTRKIYPNKGEVKGWRVKFQEMYAKGVRAQHVEAAVKQLTEKNLVVSSPFSIYNTAVDLANRPQQMTFEGRMKYNSKGELVADE